MDDKFAMDVLETMARMFETLTARIETTEKKLEESHQCSCRMWKGHTGGQRPLVRGLDESFVDMHQ